MTEPTIIEEFACTKESVKYILFICKQFFCIFLEHLRFGARHFAFVALTIEFARNGA